MYDPLLPENSPEEVTFYDDFKTKDVLDDLPKGCDGILLNWEVIDGNNDNSSRD